VGDEARPRRRQRQRQRRPSGSGDAGSDRLDADGLALRVEDGDADPQVGAVAAAEAELPRAAPIEGPQREAEEFARFPRRRLAVKSRERDRVRGPDGQDQALAGLRDAGVEEVARLPGQGYGGRSLGLGGREGAGDQGAEQGRDAQDLARAADQGGSEGRFRLTGPY
jgi:hypothetical protein